MAAPKFIADADLSERLIAGVRRRETRIDFLTAAEGGTRGLKDADVLAIAAVSGRVLVSHDCRTMPKHFQRFLTENTSPGLILVRQETKLAWAIEVLFEIWSESTEKDLRDQVTWVRRQH
jgi:hypothetical protein